MGEFIRKDTETVQHFDTITNKAFRKLIALGGSLKSYIFKPIGRSTSMIIYYDTPENLLKRAGILLYKTFERGKYYFKLEKLSFLPKAFKVSGEEIFVHEIYSAKDTPENHALYLIDAITSMFATQFNIDLENVLKVARPKMVVEIKADMIKVFSGTGFKCEMGLEKVLYRNFETKKKVKKDEVSFTLDSPINFIGDYKNFINTVTKYCKDITELTESRYEHATNLTKIIEVPKESKKIKKQKEQKAKRAEDIIEG